MANTVAFILGNTFRRIQTQNKIVSHFHLVYDIDLPEISFTLDGEPHKVSSYFQIWQAKYDKQGNPIPREKDKSLNLLKKGHWSFKSNNNSPVEQWHYTGSYDSTANLCLRNWGSLARLLQIMTPTETKQMVEENKQKLKERKKSGKSVKGFDPSPSFYYIHAKNPKLVTERFTQNHHLAKKVGKDRGMGNSSDLTHLDVLMIYLAQKDTDYNSGWKSHPVYE